MDIYRIGTEEPLRFAAAELGKYLGRATGSPIRRHRRKTCRATGGIWLATLADLGLPVGDSPDDDAIHIEVSGGDGIIAGSNPRSVLLAVYRFLTELGFRWVRPGRSGQVIPALTLPIKEKVSVHEQASYRYRTVCIEGASGWPHVRDMIDWMPKLGFNSYFVQFREGYHFFERWYRHELNPRMKNQRFTLRDARTFTRRIWAECRKRGMKIQMVGHGWTCEPFGVKGLGWYQHKGPIPRSIKRHLAQVDGRREFWGGVPLNTNLCYGNNATRRIMVNAVADYAAANPHVDAIHLWLADGSNNHCECPKCRDHRPADLYVRLLNELDAELTRRHLAARIVFLIYVDLLWPPKVERFRNRDRFILMFAPITRTYTHSFGRFAKAQAKLPPYRRNKLKMPTSIATNLAFLRAWQRLFGGDGFDFDYHLMWDHFKDPGHVGLARVMYEDIKALGDIGLNGFNSCQVHRCFLPSGLIMTVLGRTLWDRDLDFDRMADDHYQAAFGKDWPKVRRYTERLSELFDPPFLRGERPRTEWKDTARKVARIPSVIQRFRPVIEANRSADDACRAKSWAYLQEHAELCLALVPVIEAAADDRDHLAERWEQLLDTVRRKEPRLHPVLDVYWFIRTLGGALGCPPA